MTSRNSSHAPTSVGSATATRSTPSGRKRIGSAWYSSARSSSRFAAACSSTSATSRSRKRMPYCSESASAMALLETQPHSTRISPSRRRSCSCASRASSSCSGETRPSRSRSDPSGSQAGREISFMALLSSAAPADSSPNLRARDSARPAALRCKPRGPGPERRRARRHASVRALHHDQPLDRVRPRAGANPPGGEARPRTRTAPRRGAFDEPPPGKALRLAASDEDVLEELAGAPARSPVHVSAVALLELEARGVENLRVEVARVIHDDHDRSARRQGPGRFAQDAGDPAAVRGECVATGPARRRAELELAAVVEPEQLVGVPMLFVVVDQPRVRRRGDDSVVGAVPVDDARVPVQDRRVAPEPPDARERLDPREGVERVPTQELSRGADRPALASVLVAPVRRELRPAREVEVEVRRPSRGARGARKDDAQDVRVLIVADEAAPEEQLRGGLGRVPLPHVRRSVVAEGHVRRVALESGAGVAELALEDELVVARGLDAHQQAIERRDVRPGGVEPALERLDERRTGARERVENAPAGREVAVEEHLDELRDELPEVRMEAMDVLRPLALGEVALRPREVGVYDERSIELVLSQRHLLAIFGAGTQDPSSRTTSRSSSRAGPRTLLCRASATV